ncbi:MAG TPA: hypothetical protein VNN20_14290 [Thermodesulfobacteriota bacterium]|nr:hypothetical protein [Thermodesulfobacteriota bacterium]
MKTASNPSPGNISLHTYRCYTDYYSRTGSLWGDYYRRVVGVGQHLRSPQAY